jgi:hypothetical protein
MHVLTSARVVGSSASSIDEEIGALRAPGRGAVHEIRSFFSPLLSEDQKKSEKKSSDSGATDKQRR